jgi:anaerobic dimethyl sulfoxide reductase subunit A
MVYVPDGEWDEAIEEIYREAYETWAKRDDIATLSPPSWEEFQKKPVFRFPLEGDPYYPFKHEVEAGANPFAGTASGKIEFHSKALAQGPEYLRTHEVPPGSGKCYGAGNLPPMAQMTLGGKGTFYSEDTERYPLLMSSPHSYYRVHSWLDNSPFLRCDCYRHAVWMNVADAKSRGIKDNDLVRVFSDIGETVVKAYVTSRIVPGTVAIHHGGWYLPREGASALMPDGVDWRGAPNLFTHEEDLPNTVVGTFPCKGLVQIERWGGAR